VRSDPNTVRLVIAGEPPIFREGLRRLLEAESELLIVSGIGSESAVVTLVREHDPEILLLALTKLGRPAVETLRELAASGTSVRTIILSDSVDSPDVVGAMQLGARGVVPRDSAPDVLFKSIQSVRAGHFWIGREQISGVLPSLRKLDAARRQSKAFGLTRREIEILRAVVAGCTNKEIAERSAITENTVKSHLTHIFNKSGASNRVELALFATHHRLLDGI
jgi:two-component system, NarL family, nitrate/nitrite response regulator NarL